jgi:hypothetical protein
MVDSPSIAHGQGKRRRSAFLRTSTVAIAGSALAFGSSAVLLGPTAGNASSHREAPAILSDPQVDDTDVYAFVSPDKPDTVTFISNWQPFQEPGGGPNFYPWATKASYYINLDTDGDSEADIKYRWTFRDEDQRAAKETFLYNNGPVTSLTDENLLFRQRYTLTEMRKGFPDKVLFSNGRAAPSNVGIASMPSYLHLRNQAVKTLPGGTRSYVGQADDPFFLDLRVFDLLYGANLSQTGANTLAGFNVNTIAFQIPKSALRFKGGETVVGVWSSTERPSTRVNNPDGSVSYSGEDRQVSRLGNPLVNEVVMPIGLKDAFNAIPPSADRTIPAVVDRVHDPEVPKLIEAIYGLEAPATPRDDLFSIYLTGLKGLNQPKSVQPAEMLRLNTAIAPTARPNRLGVLAGDNAGFPNGRRLTDDVVDISLQALEGAVTTNDQGMATGVKIVPALAAGDRVNYNDKTFQKTFPYVAIPWSGSKVRPGSEGNRPPAIGTRENPAVAAPASNGGGGGTESRFAFAADLAPAAPAGAAGLGALLALMGVFLLRRERRTITLR